MAKNFDSNRQRRRICFVATVPIALKWFMSPHITLLKEKYDITLVANGSSADLVGLLDSNISFMPLKIERQISIKNDILSLINLCRLFHRERFDSVHSIMPKSGMLSMLAARLVGVPLRFHTFTGQVWVTQKGLRKFLLKFFDKFLVINATRVLADSHSQRLFLIENKIVSSRSISVLAEGSFSGVDLVRFNYNAIARHQVRLNYKIPSEGIVFLFLGRLKRDKGLVDLLRAFEIVAERKKNVHLLIVGPDEDNLETEVLTSVKRFPRHVHRFGYTERPEDYLSASDVLCLPSYREGFPNVPLQAASIGIPTIGSKIYGIIDAVEDGMTGLLHQPYSIEGLADAMLLLASNKDLRLRMGVAAHQRVMSKFSEQILTKAFADFYFEAFLQYENNLSHE